MLEMIEPFMTWKAFAALAGGGVVLSMRKAIFRVFSALADTATEKVLVRLLEHVAKRSSNTLDDEIVEAVKRSLNH